MEFDRPGNLPTEVAPASPISDENSWVLWNLQKAFKKHNPLEHQLYGPVNSFLVAIFVLRRLFSVGPQHVHRPVMNPSHIKGSLSNVSVGSTGGLHWSRSSPQDTPEPKQKQYPDFTVFKIIATPSQEQRETFLICIVEVKCRSSLDLGNDEDENQMAMYMDRMVDLPNRDDVFYGFLLVADTCTYERWMSTRGQRGNVVRVVGSDIPIFGGEAPLAQVLGELATAHW